MYPWHSHAFWCGDLNNAPAHEDNTSGHSHMLSAERSSWNNLLTDIGLLDLWDIMKPGVQGYTFQHIVLSLLPCTLVFAWRPAI